MEFAVLSPRLRLLPRSYRYFFAAVPLLFHLVYFASSGAADVTGRDLRRFIEPKIHYANVVFQSECKAGEVIVMETASVEQPAGQTCAETVPSSQRCLRDVRSQMDDKCSGMQSCQFQVRDLCNGTCDATSSLNVTYTCVQVVSRDCLHSCGLDGSVVMATDPEGYLTSTTSEKKCGTSECPWNIMVSPGQTINITLLDFSGEKKSLHRGSRPSPSDSGCVVVKERANPKEVQECMGRQRERLIYSTVSNTLEVRLSPKDSRFLIHYEAIGCPDVVPPRNSRMKRTWNTCEIDCPGTELKWVLTCQGHKWQGVDQLKDCPGNYFAPGSLPKDEKSASSSSSSVPTSILIAAVVALTVIIAVLVLTIGFVCLKKHQYESKQGEPVLYGGPTSEFEFCTGITPIRGAILSKTSTTTSRSTRSGARMAAMAPVYDNTFSPEQQLEMQPLHRPLPSIPNNGHCGSWRPNEPKRIVVQVNHAGSGTKTMSVPQYPTMMMRDGRMLPCNCGGTLGVHPSQMSINRPPSHLYFTLDPEVEVEEPATPLPAYPTIDSQRGADVQTVPRAHHKAIAPPPPCSSSIEMDHANSQEMVPLNLTNRSKPALQNPEFHSSTNQIPVNQTPRNQSTMHRMPPNPMQMSQMSVDSIKDAQMNSIQVNRNPSIRNEPYAHS